MHKGYEIIFAILIWIFTPILSFSQESSLKLTVGEIVKNPSLYEDKIVIVQGKYGGWGMNEGSGEDPVCKHGPQVTESDYTIYDNSGCIYVDAYATIVEKSGKVNPFDRDTCGTAITVKGVVLISEEDNIPYIGREKKKSGTKK